MKSLQAKLKKEFQTKAATCVQLESIGGYERIRIWYHETPVVTIFKNEVSLNNGGYETATTKSRINQVLELLECSERVYQKSGTWYISRLDAADVPFFNHAKISLEKSED